MGRSTGLRGLPGSRSTLVAGDPSTDEPPETSPPPHRRSIETGRSSYRTQEYDWRTPCLEGLCRVPGLGLPKLDRSWARTPGVVGSTSGFPDSVDIETGHDLRSGSIPLGRVSSRTDEPWTRLGFSGSVTGIPRTYRWSVEPLLRRPHPSGRWWE